MAGLAQGEQADGGCLAALSSIIKRRMGKKRDGTQDSQGPLPQAQASPATSEPATSAPAINADSTIPPAASQERNAAMKDNPSRSPDSDLWSRAYQELDEQTKKWIGETKEHESEEERTLGLVIQDIVTLVNKKEEEYKDKTPKLKVGGFEIKWRDYADRAVRCVTAIGDIAIPFAPAPSSVIWSAVKVLLKANVSQCEDLGAIFGCAEEVLRLIRYGQVYEIVYLSGDSCNKATQNLQNALVEMYKSLMGLLAHAFTRLNEGQGKQFLRALVSGGQGAKLVSTLTEQERKVSSAAQGCDAFASKEYRKLLESLAGPLRNVEDTVKRLFDTIEQKELEKALQDISNIPFGEHQQEKRESRTPTTCEWLMRHSEFRKWQGSDHSSTLWLQGSVGAGKSFLTSKVVDHFTARQQEAEIGEGFAYFYCSRSDPSRRETKHILRSYISQLARIPHCPTMIEKNIHMLHRQAKKENRGLSTHECKTALAQLVNFYPRTIFILDALDECEMNTRGVLAQILRDLVDQSEGTVKVFIASRKEADIEGYLGLERLVAISTADNKEDIKKYIEEEVSQVGVAWSSVSAKVKDQVKQTIVEKSDGMFRWAYLQWEQLKKLKTNESINKRLGKLPETLMDAYDEIYSDNEEKTILERAVKWVLCATEPLTSEILLTAVRLESNLQSLAPSDPIKDSTIESNVRYLTASDPIDESTLESICSHLVVLDSQLKVWKFPHASVAEYFEDRHRGLTYRAPGDVTTLLVSCLLDVRPIDPNHEAQEFRGKAQNLDNYLDPRHPLQEYASENWVQHAQNIPEECRKARHLSQVLRRFLGEGGPQQPSSVQYQAWCQRRSPSRYEWSDEFDDVEPSRKSIFGVCTFGLHKLLEGWWDKDIDVSQVNSRGLDLLAIAARYGHDGLCSELIKRGSDIHRYLRFGEGSAFMLAVARGQNKTVRLFLDKGVDPDHIRNGKSPLCLAASSCADDVVETLLEAGADPNIRCTRCYWSYALVAAVSTNAIKSTELLIEYGANVNAADGGFNFCNALVMAVLRNHLRCAKLLVANGAEVNAHFNRRFGSVLAAAIFGYGGAEMVKYLIEEAGADPTILSASPPPLPELDGWPQDSREAAARYLLKGGHAQESVLLSNGFPEEELKNIMETIWA